MWTHIRKIATETTATVQLINIPPLQIKYMGGKNLAIILLRLLLGYSVALDHPQWFMP
jgi:hypothetical protein